MTEERRIQLVADVDTTRTREGFQEIGQQATTMSATVAAAGDRAGRAVGGVGDGADRAARTVENAQRSLIGSIQRTTAAMEAGGRSSSEYFSVLARQRGIDPAILEPYLAQLRAVETAQGRANTSLGGASSALNGVQMSARATAAALRGVPAQLTDIAVSLQGGQSPLTVLFQQGGQLRDMFGSVGGAARALGSTIAGLITPLSVVVAAVVALGVAYHQGSKEAEAYSRALILTGNAAGTTSDQLSDMARNISKSIGTQGAAAEALAALAGSGRVGVENLQRFGETAVRVQKAIGQSAADTATIFGDLGKAPLATSEKLNDQYRYLTASIYAQIKALQEQGKIQEAGEVAQKAYADAMDSRSNKLIANLGLAQRAWAGITGVAKGAWDAMLDVGREDTLEQKLAKVQAAIKKGQKPLDISFGGNAEDRGSLKKNLAEEASLIAQIDWQKRLAAIEAGRLKLDEADIAWQKQKEQGLTRELQMQRDVALVRQKGLDAGASDADIAIQVGEVRKKYADIAFKSINDQIAAVEQRGKIEEEVAKRSAMAIASAQAAGIATSLAAQIGYAEQVEALDQAALAREKARLQALIALQKQLPDSPENRKAQEALRAQIALNEEQSLTRKVQLKNQIYELDVKDTRQAAANLAALSDKRAEELQSLQAQVRAQRDANAQIGMSKLQIADYNVRLAEQNALQLESRAATIGANDARKEEAAAMMASAQQMRELAAAQREGVIKSEVFEQQKAFWSSIEQTAHQTFVSIADGGKTAAQRLKDAFKNTFFDWLYQMTLKKWLVNVGTSIDNGSMASAVQAAIGGSRGASGGGSSVAGLASSASSLWTGTSDAIAKSIQTGFDKLGLSMSSGAPGQLASILGQAGSTFAGYGLGSGINSLISGQYQTGSGVQAAEKIATAVASYFGGPLGGSIAGAISGLINRTFGMGAKTQTASGIYGELGPGGASVSTYSKWAQKGGLLRSDKSGIDTATADMETVTSLGSTYKAIIGASREYAEALGVNAEYISSRSQIFDIQLGKDAAENEKAIGAFFAGVADAVAGELVPGLAKFSKEGEAASATLERLATNYAGLDLVLGTIGLKFGAVGVDSIAARERLIELSGGLQQLSTNVSGFAQNYLTESERLAPVAKAVEAALAGLGLAGVNTRDQFKQVVLGLDLTTEAGAKQYASLMGLQDAFAQVHPAIEATSAALRSAADIAAERADLQKQYDQAFMSDKEKEKAAIAATNVDLYDSLQVRLAEKAAIDAATQAAADAVAARVAIEKGIQADIDALVKASLPLSEQRKLEVAGMADTTLALYERREALQAEAKAVADAKAAADALASTNAGYQQQIDAILKARMTEQQLRDLETAGMQSSTLALYERLAGLKAEDAAAVTAAKTRADADAAANQRMQEYIAASTAAYQKQLADQEALASQYAAKETELYNLTHTEAEQLARARQLELDAMPATVAALQLQINAQKDLADAATKAANDIQAAAQKAANVASEGAGIRRDVLQLQGDTAGLRALELAALDPANRAAKQAYYDLQDKMAADQAASAAAQAIAQAQQQAAESSRRAAEALTAAWKSATDSIFDEVARIRGLIDGSGQQSYAGAQSAFAIATAQARAGDQEAAKLLPGLSKAMLDLAEANAVTAFDLRLARAQAAASLTQTGGLLGAQYGLKVPAFAEGTDYVSRTGLALIHEGEKITPAASNRPFSRQSESTSEIVAEVRALREQNADMAKRLDAALYAIAKNTGETADVLDAAQRGEVPLAVKETA